MLPVWMREPNPDIYLGDNYVVVDFETTNINKGSAREADNKLIMASWSVGKAHKSYNNKSISSKFGSEFSQEELTTDIDSCDFIVAQNTKFELQWLMRCGIKLHKVLPYDTILGKYVQDGNRTSPRNLSSIAAGYGLNSKSSLVDKLIKGGVCPSDIPKKLLQKYCEQDVRLTHQIFLRQRKELKSTNMLGVAFTRNIFTPVLCDIEVNGLYLDRERVLDKYKEFTDKQVICSRELQTLSKGINWSSPQQVAEFVYGELGFTELKSRRGQFLRNKPSKKFPDGVPKTDADTLHALKASTSTQRKFIQLKSEYSKLSKSISTYLKLFKDACENKGNYLYGSFNQAITKTHRLSSSKPKPTWAG